MHIGLFCLFGWFFLDVLKRPGWVEGLDSLKGEAEEFVLNIFLRIRDTPHNLRRSFESVVGLGFAAFKDAGNEEIST